MKIILLQDIDKLGKKHDIRQVADGYARNFLFPNKMAVLASQSNLSQLEEKKKVNAERAEEELVAFQDTATKIDGSEYEIPVKVGQEGKIFGSVTAAKINSVLKEKGFDFKKDQIKLKNPIKEMGEYEVTIEFPHNLEAKIKVIVVEEK